MNQLQMLKRALIAYVNSVKAIWSDIVYPLVLILKRKCNVKDYRIYGNTAQQLLPNEYQQVEYIESTGTQCIDTGVIANQNTGFEIQFLSNNSISSTSGEYGAIFGARTSSSVDEYQLTTYRADSTPDYQGTFRFGTISYDGGIISGEKNKVSLLNGTYVKNNGDEAVLEGEFATPCTLTLFALNNNGTPTQHGSLQLFGFKLYDGDALVRDFIPCYRKSDNVIGLYDFVNNAFYTNSGTGDFIKGLDAPTTEAPIEMQSVGDLTTKNLFNPVEWFPDYANNLGGVSAHIRTDEFADTKIELDYLANAQYTFSGNYEITFTESNALYISIAYEDGTSKTFYDVLGGNFKGTKTGHFSITSEAGRTISFIKFSYSLLRDVDVVFSNMQIERGAETGYTPYGKYIIPITVRGKNYFDLNKVPFSNSTTQPYNNGLKAQKASGNNRGNKIPISLPLNKTIYMTMDVVDSQIAGTATRVTMGFYNNSNTLVHSTNVTSTIAHKSYSFTLSEEVSYIQFYFQSASASNAVGDYVTMDNIMIRTEGEDVWEPYIEPQTVNIYLDEPLRKVGDYADYIDCEGNKVVRNIKQETITEIDTMSSSNTTYRRFTPQISEKPLISGSASTTKGIAISNKFKNIDVIYNDLGKYGGVIMPYISTAGANMVALTFNSKSINTVEKAQNAIGDGFDVCYVLAEPTEANIVLPKISQFKGTTIYEVQTQVPPSGMEVCYYG